MEENEKYFKCRFCGEMFDPELGKCPNCGTAVGNHNPNHNSQKNNFDENHVQMMLEASKGYYGYKDKYVILKHLSYFCQALAYLVLIIGGVVLFVGLSTGTFFLFTLGIFISSGLTSLWLIIIHYIIDILIDIERKIH